MSAENRLECEVRSMLGCNGIAVREVKGPLKEDPKFKCCLGCFAILTRGGLKLKEVK